MRAVFFVEERRMIKINGELVTAAGKSVAAYLAEAGYDSRAVAVEYNEVILPKADYEATILADGDVVEIVCFMGGGR